MISENVTTVPCIRSGVLDNPSQFVSGQLYLREPFVLTYKVEKHTLCVCV